MEQERDSADEEGIYYSDTDDSIVTDNDSSIVIQQTNGAALSTVEVLPPSLGESEPVIRVDGLDWRHVDRIDAPPTPIACEHPTANWDVIDLDATDPRISDIFQCFKLMFPHEIVDQTLALTSANIDADPNKTDGSLTIGEFYKYLGVRLAMALEGGGGSIDRFWAVNDSEESIFMARKFGERFHMSKNRFKCIERNLQFCVNNENDKWWPIRRFVGAFNDRMKKCFSPGRVVTVDELMAYWLGKDGKFEDEGLPHVTKMKSKPRGVGLMMKAMADGSTNIICCLEPQEGREVSF
jgi:hypothetical protein